MTELGSSSISALAKDCMQDLNQVSKLLDGKKNASKYGNPRIMVRDEFDRFKIWAGNIGATLKPESRASLDHRLNAAPSVARLVHDCLLDLKESLTGSESLSSWEKFTLITQ